MATVTKQLFMVQVIFIYKRRWWEKEIEGAAQSAKPKGNKAKQKVSPASNEEKTVQLSKTQCSSSFLLQTSLSQPQMCFPLQRGAGCVLLAQMPPGSAPQPPVSSEAL